MSKSRNHAIAALDIGTSKVCCLIAQAGDDGEPVIVGIGHQVARGVKNGAIADMEAAREAVRAAVHSAEEMADTTIRNVFVNVSTGAPKSVRFETEVPVAGHEVGAADMRRVLDHGRAWRNGEVRDIVHAIPVSFSLDGHKGVDDPQGMVANKLGVEMHLVTALTSGLRNLSNCLARCYLQVDEYVASPYAAALACLSEDEIELGTAVIDMGGGTTSIAVFDDGEMVFTGSIPVGGHHVTTDLAQGLSTPIAQAERIKTLHGTAMPASSDARKLVDVPLIAGDPDGPPNQVARTQIADVVRPRIEETFEMLRDRLNLNGPGAGSLRRMVLTGGASQLEGAREVAADIFDTQVRLGRPARLSGLAESVAGPAFSVAAGLLRFATTRHDGRETRRPRRTGVPNGLFGRFGHWLHENF